MAQKGGFKEVLFKKIMPMVYGIGASVVIVGAMFKILHIPGAGFMLGVGLTTEAIIFFLSAFEPSHDELDWSKVYPELKEESGEFEEEDEFGMPATSENATKKLDDMFNEANINDELLDRLGEGFTKLSETVSGLNNISDAASATNEYADSARSASGKLREMNDSYDKTASAMSELAGASEDAKEYHEQVQQITKNLGALNSVYELELQDANSHLKAMNKFYSNLSVALENIAEAEQDTETFRSELSKLSSNLTSLNNVYGNILAAMKA
ncbi:gliding motility protein GldL [Hyphobacterium sp. CCMP332]|nr:gliding motility protein GldL [Hyphobacterium sp. CCMP332]